MATALGFGGRLGLLGAMLHMLFHAVTKPLLFFCAGNVQQHFGTPYLWKIRGAIRTMPLTSVFLLMATLAVTAVPPFSIFQSEFTVLSAGFASNHDWLAGLFVVCVVTIFAGFLHHMVQMNLGVPREETPRTVVCPWKHGAIALVAGIVVVLGVWLPSPLFQLVQRTTQIIGGAP